MMKIFKRYWYVPANSANEIDVPNRLRKMGITYNCSRLTNYETGYLEGYIYRFNCLPGIYEVLRASIIGGNGFAPLEVRDFG